MKAQQIIIEGTHGPQTFRVLIEAFDAAWASVADQYQGSSAELIEAARLALAHATLSIAREDSRDVEALKTAALQAMARHLPPGVAPAIPMVRRMAKKSKESEEMRPSCTCAAGAQVFEGRNFSARGTAAMQYQEWIVNFYNRMPTIRTFSAYAASVMFVIVSASLIVFAPEGRELAANIAAGALLMLAAGWTGFIRFLAKLLGMQVTGDTPPE